MDFDMNRVANNYSKSKKQDATLGIGITSYQKLDKDNIKFIVSSSEELDLNKIIEFIYSSFDYALIPVNRSLRRYHGDDKLFYATVIAHRSPKICAKVETSTFVKLNANSYLNEEMGTVWEKEKIGEEDFYVRQNDDDLDEVMDAISLSANIGISAAFDMTTFNPKYDVGSEVDVYYIKNSKPIIEKGKVTGLSKENVSVSVGGGKIDVPSGSIVKVYPGKGEETDVVDFLKKCYNPKGNVDFDYGALFNK